jgi:cell division septum initiation protein DivIVA
VLCVGEKLSQKQLKLESTIKQLRTKEKESDSTIASLKELLADAEARVRSPSNTTHDDTRRLARSLLRLTRRPQVELAQSKTRDNDSLLAKYNDMVAGLKEAAELAGRHAEDKDRIVAAAQQRVSELEAPLLPPLSLFVLCFVFRFPLFVL